MNMVELLHALDLDLPHNGKIYCIFHAEATPSLHIYEDHWYAYCCGRGGDVIAFVMGFFGCSYGKALQWLGSNLDVDPEDVKLVVRQNVSIERPTVDLTERFLSDTKSFNELSSTERNEVETFCKLRWGVEPGWLRAFDVRVANFGLAVPHYDTEGRVVGIKLRSFSGAKTSVSGSKFTTQLYRAWSGIEPHSKVRAVLVEGESDAWVMYARFGLEFAVYALPSGASTWRDEWGEELVKNHQQIVVVFDNDDAGQKARERVKVALKKHQHLVVHRFLPDEFNDICDAEKAGWQGLWRLLQ